MTGQMRTMPIDHRDKVSAAGERLGRAVLASLKRAPRCACGSEVVRVQTKVEIVGSTLAVDLVLRCSVCA